MMELIVTACMLSSPAECHREKLPFEGSLMVCAQFGQMAAAQWQTTHPKWEVRRLDCRPPGKDI